MLLAKCKQTIPALQQIRTDVIPVIIATHIHTTQNGIRAMMGNCRKNRFVFSK